MLTFSNPDAGVAVGVLVGVELLVTSITTFCIHIHRVV